MKKRELFDDEEKPELLPEIIPDYNSDTSDEETENTVGNIPMEWYKEFDHIGYDINGKKISKQPVNKDELDKFVDQMDNPEVWRSVFNELEGKNVNLTSSELEMIKRIQSKQFPNPEFNPYPETVEWFTSKTELHPISSAPEPKSRFIPSKWEHKKIMKLVRSIRKGYIQSAASRVPVPIIPNTNINLWKDAPESIDDNPLHIPAPKAALPGNEESYNPPEEYLPDADELKDLQQRKIEEKSLVIPKKFSALRNVPSYTRFIEERFDRLLDLYLCPRMMKKRIQVDPETLIPKLPDPKDLQPFPSNLSIVFKGHEKNRKIKSISVHPLGQFLASGSDDKCVKIWEIATGRCVETVKFESPIIKVSWNPNKAIVLLSVILDKQAVLIVPSIYPEMISKSSDSIFLTEVVASKPHKESTWRKPTPTESKLGYRLILDFKKEISYFAWHRKGDYFATLTGQASSTTVLIHQLSKRTTQSPFKKTDGIVQCVLFHPNKPILFIATQRFIRVYNLIEQKLVKKLITGMNWISSMDIHPQNGDHLIVGSFDRKLVWFDMDLSVKPYRTLRYHKNSIRHVTFHKRYPLFASCSDDTTLNLFHGMVYSNLMQNPLIVPVKSLRVCGSVESLGALCCEFHPTQPWIFSSGADGLIKLYV